MELVIRDTRRGMHDRLQIEFLVFNFRYIKSYLPAMCDDVALARDGPMRSPDEVNTS